MPDTRVLDKSLGSRHRAALGITEETDAVVVVVSEERGTISFCFNGNIVSSLDGASLRQALLGLFGQRTRKKKGVPERRKPGQTQTGSFRITLPQLAPEAGSSERSGERVGERTGRESAVPPSTGGTGSVLVTPLQPKVDPPIEPTRQGLIQVKTQPIQPIQIPPIQGSPMPQAAPIETPLRGSAIEAPLRGSAIEAPLRGSAIEAPLRGSAIEAPLRGSAIETPKPVPAPDADRRPPPGEREQ
jgi:hypothetical protein